MKQYLNLMKNTLNNGVKKKDRTGTGTISLFGTQQRYDLSKGFPIVTTKKIHWKSIVHELIWFIKGDTNIKYLVENDVRIWNEWPYVKFKSTSDYNGETMEEFISKIKFDDKFAKKHGELGPVYGKQWRNFGGVDQLKEVIEQIKNNPDSRRLIVSAWNPPDVPNMALPPCHAFYQFYVVDNKLSCQLYQRSADVFLGVPFNISSYSLLTHLIAKECGLQVGEFIHTTGDTHIYSNHINQIKEQLQRKTKSLPMIKIRPGLKSIFDVKYEDISLEGYDPHPLIKGKVAV